MTEVDLEQIGFRMENKVEAINWLYCRYGSTSEGVWKLRGLRYIQFKNPKDATFFVLKWS